jgi:hypothetical protein
MTGVFESHGEWSEGIYENTFVKDDGVWKIQDLRYFPTFISDYDQGWAADAKPASTASAELPPDRPPTSVYAIYPKAHIPPFHYDNRRGTAAGNSLVGRAGDRQECAGQRVGQRNRTADIAAGRRHLDGRHRR